MSASGEHGCAAAKKVSVVTLGCRLNQADTALMSGRLVEAGFSVVSPDEAADVVIVNTCSVTATAARKSRAAAKKARERNPGAIVVACGCDCERDPDYWSSATTVDCAAPNAGKIRIADIVGEGGAMVEDGWAAPSGVFREESTAIFPFRQRAFVKVQDGCDSFCSYCVVPLVRGRERSRARSEVLDEVRYLVDAGHREIILTGVNISSYDDCGVRLFDLVDEIVAVPGDFRVRLSSMEPHPENRRVLDLMATNSKVCRFLHVPLQHGSDDILERMGRGRSTTEFADFAAAAADKVPGIHLGTDIIVGFPGETDELFERSLDFVASLPLANIHVFRFSPREGTPAADFPDKVPQRVAKERASRMGELARRLSAEFAESQIGERLTVLVERGGGGSAEGWSDNYLRIQFPSDATEGELVDVTLQREFLDPNVLPIPGKPETRR